MSTSHDVQERKNDVFVPGAGLRMVHLYPGDSSASVKLQHGREWPTRARQRKVMFP
jgi:hypothetical protein